MIINLPSGERTVELLANAVDAEDVFAKCPANGPALIFGGSSSVSRTLAEVIGLRYELRGTAYKKLSINLKSLHITYFTYAHAYVTTFQPHYQRLCCCPIKKTT